jgi:hypothetical protein
LEENHVKKRVLVVVFAVLIATAAPANARGTGMWGGKTAGNLLSRTENNGKTAGISAVDLISLLVYQVRAVSLLFTSR